MPPVQPSLRGSLLTGASVVTLSVSASGAHAQNVHPGATPSVPPPVFVWVEGALFQPSPGGSFNIQSIPGLGAPYTAFNPLNGIEGAFGFGYQPSQQPWHFIFDFRYGRTRTTAANSATSSSSSSRTFQTFGTTHGILLTQTVLKSTANSAATGASEWESHAVADFMAGRDTGLGFAASQVQFGIRIADLYAAAHAQQSAQSTTNTTTTSTFYSPTVFGGHGVTTTTTSASGSSSSALAAWNSQFFGAGPRVAFTGSVPVQGVWSFDYSGGIAGLIGSRSINFSMLASPGAGIAFSSSATVFVFNADGWAAVSYKLAPNLKVSTGVRVDFYDAALTTYNSAGGLSSISRTFWGPFVRLTGQF